MVYSLESHTRIYTLHTSCTHIVADWTLILLLNSVPPGWVFDWNSVKTSVHMKQIEHCHSQGCQGQLLGTWQVPIAWSFLGRKHPYGWSYTCFQADSWKLTEQGLKYSNTITLSSVHIQTLCHHSAFWLVPIFPLKAKPWLVQNNHAGNLRACALACPCDFTVTWWHH